MLSGNIRSAEDVVDLLDAVTPDDLHRVIETILKRDKLNLAVVGPHRSEKRYLPLLDL